MRIEMKRTVVAVVAVALLRTAPVLACLPAQLPDAHNQDHSAILSERASILLAEIQKETAELRPHPYTLGTFAWNAQHTLQSRVTFLDRAEGHINAVDERIAKLQHISRFVLCWQQQAITEVTSHAARVEPSIQGPVVHLRENQDRLLVAEYRYHLTTIADRSEGMKQTVDEFFDHEKFSQDASTIAKRVGARG